MHCCPFMPLQSAHIAPVVPQAAEPPPATHVVPEQQPPLQGEVMLHVVLHVPPLQASPDGQSDALAQPQVPPSTHTAPFLSPVQSTQADAEPQAVVDVPGMQVPADPPQQKPAPQAPPSQLAVQAPLAHVGVSPLHETQAPPAEPHSFSAVPATQPVPLQQPPLHVSPPVQLGEQSPVVGLHASPFGQLVDVHGTCVSRPDSVCTTTSPAEPSTVASGPPAPQEPAQVPCSAREHAAMALAAAPSRNAAAKWSRVCHTPAIALIISGGRGGRSRRTQPSRRNGGSSAASPDRFPSKVHTLPPGPTRRALMTMSVCAPRQVRYCRSLR
jgi:hypothetical protein